MKKKQTVALSRTTDNTATSSRKGDFIGVKTWLEGASEKELDGLLTWLVKRKKGIQTATAEDRPRVDQKSERTKTKSRENMGSTPTVHRNIKAEDVDQMQRQLFPEDCWRPNQKRIILGDRWDQHSRAVKLTTPSQRPREGDERKPPNLSLAANLVNNARLRLKVLDWSIINPWLSAWKWLLRTVVRMVM